MANDTVYPKAIEHCDVIELISHVEDLECKFYTLRKGLYNARQRRFKFGGVCMGAGIIIGACIVYGVMTSR